jgi:hypothetical protein
METNQLTLVLLMDTQDLDKMEAKMDKMVEEDVLLDVKDKVKELQLVLLFKSEETGLTLEIRKEKSTKSM